jgi:hypothetical protein
MLMQSIKKGPRQDHKKYKAFHNLGNVFWRKKKLYRDGRNKTHCRNDPSDEETHIISKKDVKDNP